MEVGEPRSNYHDSDIAALQEMLMSSVLSKNQTEIAVRKFGSDTSAEFWANGMEFGELSLYVFLGQCHETHIVSKNGAKPCLVP